MATQRALLDYIQIGVSLLTAALAAYVAVIVGSSADDINKSNLIITTVGYVVDDHPCRQVAGAQLISWLQDKYGNVPQAVQELLRRLPVGEPTVGSVQSSPCGRSQGAPQEAVPAQSTEHTAPGTTPAPAPSEPSVAAHATTPLYASLGGVLPRLFIQIADNEQRHAAEQLQRYIQANLSLDNQIVLAPGVELVPNKLTAVQLRYLKKDDGAEAQALAGELKPLLGINVEVVPLWQKYDSNRRVKRRTFELWFPPGKINLALPS